LGGFNFNCSFCFYFVCVCVGKGKPCHCVLGNCLNKDICRMQVGSLVKWWTMNKINTDAHIGKICFFQVAHSIKHSNMGCGFILPM
jgi:hypothetical protein